MSAGVDANLSDRPATVHCYKLRQRQPLQKKNVSTFSVTVLSVEATNGGQGRQAS